MPKLREQTPSDFGPRPNSILSWKKITPRELIQELQRRSLLLAEDWINLPAEDRQQLLQSSHCKALLTDLVKRGLLTYYQTERIRNGELFGLILGNYRVLDLLGKGGSGVVYKGEHLRMRQLAALKVVSVHGEADHENEMRFLAEIRAVSQLRHPNIISAFDAGDVSPDDTFTPLLHYYVMEYISGETLQERIQLQGPMPAALACEMIHQIAGAIQLAHQRQLIHRDIKPSNIMITPEGQAKLLDFGLVRQPHRRLTKPGVPMGTMAYMAPEQARDASGVDTRVDIYGLGATLFWALTGRVPFVAEKNIAEGIISRLTNPPPSIRSHRPDLPEELDSVVMTMMASQPEDRFPNGLAVQQALKPFLASKGSRVAAGILQPVSVSRGADSAVAMPAPNPKLRHILIVDDDVNIRRLCKCILQSDDLQCAEACDGEEALSRLGEERYDLVILDCAMPKMNGKQVYQRLRESPPSANMKIIMISGDISSDEMAQLMQQGVDDFLTKPFSITQLQARVNACLRLKGAQDRSDVLVQRLLACNKDMENSLLARDSDLIQARNAIVLALAKLAEYRDNETGAHLLRLERYCRLLAEEAARSSVYADQIDDRFIDMLCCCAPLHDIGKVAVPDTILQKPGQFSPEERRIMETHTVVGSDTLLAVAEHHRFATGLLHMAASVARHHHEWYNGAGYPDQLKGTDIPLAARLVAIADVYDALRSPRVYKMALSHTQSVALLDRDFGSHFDPALQPVFQSCAAQFEAIYADCTDSSE